MPELTVANYLGALQEDPFDGGAFEGLRSAIESGDAQRGGEDPARLLMFARRNHEVRGEAYAAGRLIELEIALVDSDPDLEAALWKELGRVRREELLDDPGARDAYNEALKLRPGDNDVQDAIEQLDQLKERWNEIAQHFIAQAEGASDSQLKNSLLVRAASIIWQYKKKGKAKQVDRLFKDALSTDPASARTARLYELVLRDRKKWKDLSGVLLGAAKNVSGKDEKLGLFLASARVLARELEDKDMAAECYSSVLDYQPAHDEALRFLVDYFNEHEMWDHLVALYEDALKARQLKADAEKGILLQIAMVQWRMLEAPDKAEPYFARLRKADPAQPAMLEFYREQLASEEESTQLLAVLGDAQRRAETPDEKVRLSLELAKVAQKIPSAAERAIDAWKTVLRHEPSHAEAAAALKELYRTAGKWNALVEVIKAEIDGLPVGETERRLQLLRELLPIYRDEISLEGMVLHTYNAILQVAPDDTEALEQLAQTYEGMKRYGDLIPVLQRQADAHSDPQAKIALLLRTADLWLEHFSNYNQATDPLEQVLVIEEGNRQALDKLKQIYTKKRAWRPLIEVLRKEAELSVDDEAKKPVLMDIAKLAGDRLHDHDEAIKLWKRVLELDEIEPEALDALEKLSERKKDWDTLADVLERRIALAGNKEEEVKLLSRLGSVFGERAGQPARAAEVWTRLLQVDPKNGRALRTLRESYLAASDWDGLEKLYSEANDWEGLVDVLGTSADRASDPATRVQLSFRAAEIYEQQLGESARAFRSYERVLTAEADNERASRALLPLYEKDEKWARVVTLLETLTSKLPQDAQEERLDLLGRTANAYLDKLRDGDKAFAAAVQCYALVPEDDAVRERMESAAQLAECWDKLAAAYEARADAAEAEEAIKLRRRVAQLAAERLDRPEEAAAQLEKILEANPTDEDAASILDRIYRSSNRPADLKRLLEGRLQHLEDVDQRRALLGELAVIEEELLENPDAAAVHFRAMLELEPRDESALAALDRLALAGERYEELGEVLRKRIELSEDDAERVAFMLRLGELSAGPVGDVSAAIGAFSDVLQAEPGQPSAVAALETLHREHEDRRIEVGRLLEPAYERAGELDKLSALFEERLAATDQESERRGIRLRLAELSGMRGDPQGAYSTLESAFLDNPGDRELWDRIQGIAEQASLHEQLAAAYATAIEAADLEPVDVRDLSERTATIYDEALGTPEKSEPFHKRVLAHDPLAERAFFALKDLYTNDERWEELKALYRNRISQVVDTVAKQDLLLEVCLLLEELLEDVEGAIRAYQEVLDLDPVHQTSRRALERLYTRAERWHDLVALLEGDLAEAEGKDAIELTFRIGELHELQLREASQAVDRYAAVLDEQPTHLRAQEALERLIDNAEQRQRIASILEPLYESQGAHAQLSRVLQVQLEELQDAGSRVNALLRVAELAENHLQDEAGAMKALSDAVLADPSDSTSRDELARVATLTGKLTDRADVLEKALHRVEDSLVQVELLTELAALWDEQIGDNEQAERAYVRLIDADRSNPDVVIPASKALERLHIAREDYSSLADDLRRQIDLGDDPVQQRELLVRLAELREGPLQDTRGAIAAQRERLELDPADVEAMVALQRMFEQERDWTQLIDVLQKRDTVAQDEQEARGFARRVGLIYENELSDHESAIASLNDVLSRFGNDRETLAALCRIYESEEKWQDLLEAVQADLELTEDVAERAAIRFRAAELMRTRTGEIEAAIDAYREVLEDAPGHEGSIAALDELLSGSGPARVAAAQVLVPYYESVADYERLVRSLEVAAATDDTLEKLDALRRAAEVAEIGMQEPTRAFDLMGRAVREALAEADLPNLLEELHRLAEASECWQPYADLLRDIVPDVMDEDLQLTVMMRIAEVGRDRIGDDSLSRAYFGKALELRPEHAPALDALELGYEAAGDHRGLLGVLQRKTELADDPSQRTNLLFRQAELCAQKLDDVGTAIEAYEQVLEELPSIDVFRGLDDLYRRAERWEDLAALFERQIDSDIGDAVQVRYSLGELTQTHLNDAERALDLYKEVLERSYDHEATVTALESMLDEESMRGAVAEVLEPVYLRREDWPRLSQALEAQLATEVDVATRKSTLERLAQLQEVQLDDLSAALEVYARLFQEDPFDEEIWGTLVRLARVIEKPERVAEVYEAYLADSGVQDESAAKLAVAAAQIRDVHTHNLRQASNLYKQALEFDPTQRPVADALEDVLVRQKTYVELLELYRAQVDVAEDETRRLTLLHKMAQLHDGPLENPAEAVRTYQEVMDASPLDATAIEALDRLYASEQRWSDLGDHLRAQIDHAESDSQQMVLKMRLGNLLEERLDDVEAAIDMYEDITRMNATHRESVGALERLSRQEGLRARIAEILQPLYEASGDVAKRVDMNEQLLSIEQDPGERSRLLAEIGRLYEEEQGNKWSAMATWRRAFVADPADGVAREELERLATELEDWDTLVAAYEEAVETASDEAVRAELLGAIARTHDEKRGDPRAAIEGYERLHGEDKSDPEPLQQLESLHTMVGDWSGLVDVLGRKVEQTGDPVERAELRRRGGSVYEDLLGDSKGAIGQYRAALEEMDDDTASLQALDRLYEAADDFEGLTEVLQKRASIEPDSEERVHAGLRLGAVLSERPARATDAIEAYTRVLDDDGSNDAAVDALGSLYEAQGLWPELLENVRTRIDNTQEDAARVPLLFKAGQLLHQKLDDTHEAIEQYRAALEIDPQHNESIRALLDMGQQPDFHSQVSDVLEPLLREHARWDDLARLMEEGAQAVSDPMDKQQLLVRLATVHEEGRGQPSAAFDVLCEALVQDADDEALAPQVERLAEQLDQWERAADALEQRARSTSDAFAARDLYARLARISEQHLNNADRAVESYAAAAQQGGDDDELLGNLDRLHVQLEAWEPLADVLERRVPHATDDRAAADLLVRLGELRETHFEDKPGALTSYREALEREPLEPRAVVALERLLSEPSLAFDAVDILENVYREAGDLTRVAELYSTKVELAETRGEKVGLLQELAAMWESDLGAPQRALESLRKAYELDPADLGLLDELERVALGGGGFEPLRGLAEEVCKESNLDRVERRDLWLRQAQWNIDQLADRAAAESALGHALVADPEAMEAHEKLVELLRLDDRPLDLIAALMAWAEQEPNADQARERFEECAQLAEQAGDLELATTCYERVYEIDASAVNALDSLIRIHEGGGRHAQVAELFDKRIDAEVVPEERVALRHRAAQLHLEHLDGRDTALRMYEANLDDDPSDEPSMQALEGMFEQDERWEDLQQLLERRLDVAETVEDRVAARVRLARLVEARFDRRAEAIEQLQEILMDMPDHREALDELERLLVADQRWEDLIDHLDRRADQARDAGDSETELGALVRMGTVYEEQLNDRGQAVDRYNQVLERDPEHVQALRALVRLHTADGNAGEGAEILERLLSRVEGEELVEVAWQLAELCDGPLEQPVRAEEALRRAISVEAQNAESRARLAAHFEQHQDTAALAELLAENAELLADPAEKVALLRRVSDLYIDKLEDPGQAAHYLERASALQPDDRSVLLPLVDLYIAAGRQNDAVPVLEKIIASYNGRRVKEAATFHHRLGKAYQGMGDDQKAFEELEAAYRIDLTNIGILADLGLMAHARGDLERAQKTFRGLLLQRLGADAPISKADVYYYLGDIAFKQDDKPKAVSMLERAVAEQRDHSQAKELLESLKA